MRSLTSLVSARQDYSYAFLDEFAKRELRRRTLKAIALPGYQVPYASRELPIARGWGTGGLQVTLSLIGPTDVVKVIDQGDDQSVNAANLRRFIARMAGVQTTTDALAATVIQSRHRIPEEILGEGQVLVLQVPDPEPLRRATPSMTQAREMHADADYAVMWLSLYEQLVRFGTFTGGAGYPVMVHQRYLMSPSPIPRWDTPKLHRAAHLTLLSAGREKRLYAVPPYTNVRPLEFDDVFFSVEDQTGRRDARTGVGHKFMNEIPQADGTSIFELGDSGYADKVAAAGRQETEGGAHISGRLPPPVGRQSPNVGPTYFDDQGRFYHDGFLKS